VKYDGDNGADTGAVIGADSHAGADSEPSSPSEQLRVLVEEYGLLMERLGHSRAEGRLLGWLLLCEPPEQSMMDISRALNISKGGLSVGLRRLVDRGLVERRRKPGERHDFFRFDSASIGRLMENVFTGMALMERLLAHSRELPGQQKNERLLTMHALYARLTAEMPVLLERWRTDVRREIQAELKQED